MDEAFISLSQMIDAITSIDGEIYTEDHGIHSYINAFEVGTPVELDVFWDEEGALKIGSIPPMYRVSTTFRPSYHNITLKMEKSNLHNGD